MNTVDTELFFAQNPGLLVILVVVIVAAYILKGFALWRAGRNNHKGWFVAVLLVNSLGILEVVYLLTAGKKRS